MLFRSMEPPVFGKEAMLGDHEMNTASHRNITILYTKWYIDQAKREEKNLSVEKNPPRRKRIPIAKRNLVLHPRKIVVAPKKVIVLKKQT